MTRHKFANPWDDAAPVREELFGIERLEQHARSLAAAQSITSRPPSVFSLHRRLKQNASVLLAAYRSSAHEIESDRAVVPAAEWLLDNYHLVDEQIREIHDDLPPNYYRQLPKLADGPFAGYPRIFGLTWAFVAHTDSHFDPASLTRFIAAYQQVQPLTIGELWAVAITLRIVLVENLRRLADQIIVGRTARLEADALADSLLAEDTKGSSAVRMPSAELSELFAAQLAKRLRDRDPRTTPSLGWLEDQLARQGSTIETVVQHAQQRQGASNVTIRNIITSMRLISDIDWGELVESVSLVDACLSDGSDFVQMDFASRDLYRSAIEQLARGSTFTELEIAQSALALAKDAAEQAGSPTEAERLGDPGYHLIDHGRRALERAIGFRPNAQLHFGRTMGKLGIGGYVLAITAITLALVASLGWIVSASAVPSVLLFAFLVLAIVPASEVAAAVVNRTVSVGVRAARLPGLELAAGIPSELRTLVVVPTMLVDQAQLLQDIEQLEVHYLSGAGGDISFALLTDGLDADTETVEGDEALLDIGQQAISALNTRHGPGPAGDRFLLLHRARRFNVGEGLWMGWERKRGKLTELNWLLRGAGDTSFGTPHVPADVRYVITLDADTKLPREATVRLVGKMAHPLNRPRLNARGDRVVDGYAIIQPRVATSLPIGQDSSLYQRVFSAPGGIDPYAAAVSDVYQDLFGEGSYTGKGIYDVDGFEAALARRIPENTMLSHDLFEGIYARAGLSSDVEVVDDFPTRYDVAVRRQHRWTRGDWQLLPWLVRDGKLPTIGRWKMLDNLRRSLVAPTALFALFLACLMTEPANAIAIAAILLALIIPVFVPILFSILPHSPGLQLRSHLFGLARDFKLAALQVGLGLAFLPDQAWRNGDAIVRTLFRLTVSRKHLLEWTTAASAGQRARLTLLGFYRDMAKGTALAILLFAGAMAITPTSLAIALPLVLLWLAAPAIAFWTSRSPATRPDRDLGSSDAKYLRLIARQTWRYFETYVTPLENMLPPDNFQETPVPSVAHRTSPTNIGLYLLSAVAARDFGWAGTLETIDRLEKTFATLGQMRRFNGHFFNWYDTRDLRVLDPAYVSSVDSGNLAGHLIALANACAEWAESAPLDTRQGLMDNVVLARKALALSPSSADPTISSVLDEIQAQMETQQSFDILLPTLLRLSEKGLKLVSLRSSSTDIGGPSDLTYWVSAFNRRIVEATRDRRALQTDPKAFHARLIALESVARSIALDMDFAFLLDPDRKLLSIGFSLPDNRLDLNCYDLLASEARLASLFAIAKGDVSTRHWFRLGRTATPLGNGSALISWSGSMFEYLMPSLVMRAPAESLLDATNRLVVARQEAYGRARNVPWGISESAYNVRDYEFTYQYSNFGVPGLGLKRGLSSNMVIAPYATGLAAMVDPRAAIENFRRIERMGARGTHGFYEALDFTRSRLPDDDDLAIVRSYMAHHQGMTITAIANVLSDGIMRARFHREPMIKASELLLSERVPRDVAIARPRAEEIKAASDLSVNMSPVVRKLALPYHGAPITHLLSNGRYTVMLTASGSGYSRWRDIAIIRWREDVTRDDCGAFVFCKDLRTGLVFSATQQPMNDSAEAIVEFGEDHAQFRRHDQTMTTEMDVLVSGEDDSEVRLVCFTNSGRRPRDIEVTSYAELVLAAAATDDAHPAFAKMFVQTEYLSEFGALVATRRRRSPSEPEIWAAHFAVVEGEVLSDPQYETDRSRFLGRNRSLGDAAAIHDNQGLSGTLGTVLDPVFALRRQLRIPPGKVAKIAFWTVVASSRVELLELIDKHHDRSAYERAKTLAWTQAQVQLHHLDVSLEEAADFQRLAAPILYADPVFRPSSDAIMAGAGPQSGLWPHGISGDLPIVLLRIDALEDMPQLRQMLRAHEYWRIKRLAVDLVIINERGSSYVQDLQNAIEAALRSSQSRPRYNNTPAQGNVYLLRADLLGLETRNLLQASARVVFLARMGSIADQIADKASRTPPLNVKPFMPAQASSAETVALPDDLEFFNGLGGFANNGTEYVTALDNGATTPAPWINVVANEGFGFQVSSEGSFYTWAGNSRENQITPWSNDPVSDPVGEAIYVKDEASGALWSPTARPIRNKGRYLARHGYGYSRFSHQAYGIESELVAYVPLVDPVRISRMTLTNRSQRVRRLSITSYTEFVLGTQRGATAPFLLTKIDAETGAIFATNKWATAFGGRVAFTDLGGRQTASTADRTEFLGRNGSTASAAALSSQTGLSGTAGAGHDPCAALQTSIELAVGESIEIVCLLGQAGTEEEARQLIERYRSADLDGVLAEVAAHWHSILGAVQVRTPDRAMDIMLNGWLLYQTLACRITARSAFYQASGAYGFRDQLQDGMALSLVRPQDSRHHILRAAGRQFIDGDVQHWWLPHSGQGVRTRISDDCVWLAFSAATYAISTGDADIFDELVPFIEGPKLAEGEHDNFFQPMISERSASLFEHCALGLDLAIKLTGQHGLPLMGTGDWNDGMNRVGEDGRGESVWLGWLLIRALDLLMPYADIRDPKRAKRWRLHSIKLKAALEREAWDGAWYRRATFDDGSWLGSQSSDECRIDSIAQSWAVLSGGGDPIRASVAMSSLDRHLIRPDLGLALLFTPPFDQTPRDPGYIKGYPPGLRENGGQYSHAAMWAILAFAKLGQGKKAFDLFALVNPINHALTAEAVALYKVEPYVLAADVYSVAPHTGRGGWTWYTGSAGWMYRAGIEGILGISREGDTLIINPCLPADWPGFSAELTVAGTQYEITVHNRGGDADSLPNAVLDGVALAPQGKVVRLRLDGGTHTLSITLRPLPR
ncbi:glycosyl transferase [Devosia sp. MC532]|uniref:GH36-type glycosyl hydrolase domain-containing protein n=1 Tax=Devosia sp. MC532 TaxID=2799788 RepID=UPI0018F6D86C|nr:glucoamylase family protein [Devosia sp. MC532]MBJ7579500.1 glycosyl transferase [Devosia sp. MC532]